VRVAICYLDEMSRPAGHDALFCIRWPTIVASSDRPARLTLTRRRGSVSWCPTTGVPERAQGSEGLDASADVAIELTSARRCRGEVIAHETGIGHETVAQLVRSRTAIGDWRRRLREVASTRVLIAAGRLVAEGLSLRDAAAAVADH